MGVGSDEIGLFHKVLQWNSYAWRKEINRSGVIQNISVWLIFLRLLKNCKRFFALICLMHFRSFFALVYSYDFQRCARVFDLSRFGDLTSHPLRGDSWFVIPFIKCARRVVREEQHLLRIAFLLLPSFICPEIMRERSLNGQNLFFVRICQKFAISLAWWSRVYVGFVTAAEFCRARARSSCRLSLVCWK